MHERDKPKLCNILEYDFDIFVCFFVFVNLRLHVVVACIARNRFCKQRLSKAEAWISHGCLQFEKSPSPSSIATPTTFDI